MKAVHLVICLLGQVSVVGLAAADARLQQQVEADHAAWRAAERDYRSRLQRGELSRAAASDYAAYLGFLRQRFVAGCHTLLAAGEALQSGSPCLGVAAAKPLAAESKAPPGRAERQAALDAELDAGMAEFDEMLLREQQRVRAASPPAQGTRAALPGSGGEDAREGGVEAASGAAAEGGGEARPGSSTAGPNQDRRAATKGPGAGGGSDTDIEAPPDVSDAGDDDVVARQLREAAEQERDPALKKKLWEEYRRYKQGIR